MKILLSTAKIHSTKMSFTKIYFSIIFQRKIFKCQCRILPLISIIEGNTPSNTKIPSAQLLIPHCPRARSALITNTIQHHPTKSVTSSPSAETIRHQPKNNRHHPVKPAHQPSLRSSQAPLQPPPSPFHRTKKAQPPGNPRDWAKYSI